MAKKKQKKPKKAKLKGKKPTLRSETKKGILAIVCFALAILSFLSFFGGAGLFGRYFVQAGRFLFGQALFLICLTFLLIGLAALILKQVYKIIFIGAIVFVLSILGIFYVISEAGGYLGLIIGYPLVKFLGFWASLIILLALLIISILITFNIPLIPLKKEKEKEEIKPIPLGEKLLKALKPKKIESQEQIVSQPEKEDAETLGDSFSTEKAIQFKATDFKLPPLDFLEKDKGQPTSGDIKANINIIKQTLENFNIEVEMAEVSIGPTVTQYTLRPAQGVKLSQITALQNDLALALAAHPLRIEAPIPGRSLVGIEIPNRSVILVRLRTLLERPTFQESSSSLTFALGRDVAGNPMFADLAKMPHLLVAGATGTGKTIALNNLIISLLYRNFPETLKLILIDPKRVELTTYDSIPYLLAPVVVQADKAVSSLRWAVSEMERRFEVLQESGQRDINAYNNSNQRLPYIVIVIDELADLMASHGREVEATIVRLAQMARAVGIHLVVSTQRPSVEVITGLIKANITSRMTFQVASQVDSRTVLDMAGAEKLLGNGDMLFLAGNTAKPRRVQGAYVSDKEVKKVVDYLRKAREAEYNEEIVVDRGPSIKTVGSERDDELYEEAKEVIIQAGKASASLLQRRLRIGYARAARLLDILEGQGVVGPADGAKPRKVFIDEGEEIDME